MFKQRLKNIATAVVVPLCMLLLVSCMSNAERTFGRGGLENANVVANVLDDVGVYEKKKEPVDYSPRPPLDIPNSTEDLPTPAENLEDGHSDESNDVSSESPIESVDQSDQIANSGEALISDQQNTALNESVNHNSQNDLIDSSTSETEKSKAECQLYPAGEENDCHLIRPPDDYN